MFATRRLRFEPSPRVSAAMRRLIFPAPLRGGDLPAFPIVLRQRRRQVRVAPLDRSFAAFVFPTLKRGRSIASPRTRVACYEAFSTIEVCTNTPSTLWSGTTPPLRWKQKANPMRSAKRPKRIAKVALSGVSISRSLKLFLWRRSLLESGWDEQRRRIRTEERLVPTGHSSRFI